MLWSVVSSLSGIGDFCSCLPRKCHSPTVINITPSNPSPPTAWPCRLSLSCLCHYRPQYYCHHHDRHRSPSSSLPLITPSTVTHLWIYSCLSKIACVSEQAATRVGMAFPDSVSLNRQGLCLLTLMRQMADGLSFLFFLRVRASSQSPLT